MSRAVAIGDERVLAGFALAGVEVVRAADARSAFESLPDDVGLVVLTEDAAAALMQASPPRPELLTVVLNL